MLKRKILVEQDHEERRGFITFLVMLAMPFLLIFGGVGVVALGVSMSSLFVIVFGAVLVLAGLLWGGILLLWHGPLDLF